MSMEDSARHPHIDQLKEKAHEPRVVHGHVMEAADIFKFVGLIVFIAIMALVVWLVWPYIHTLFEEDGLNIVIQDVRGAGVGGLFILFALQFIQIVVAFIPGEVIQLAAGIIYGPWIGALVIFIGCVISSAFIFLVVKKLGAPFVRSMVPIKYLSRFEHFEESGKLLPIVIVLFLIPGMPKDVFTYLVPLTKMPFGTFILATNLARIPGIIASTYAANGLLDGNIAESIVIFAIVAFIAVMAILFHNQIINWFGTHIRKGKNPENKEDK
ncbi:MAG: VTT domain-containing protein [Eggerthellaceae bacterium]|nr:VTT domain-containing protein [Eggerthellaceae bacterium]